MFDKLVVEIYRVFFLVGEEKAWPRGHVLAFGREKLPRLFIFLSFLHGLVKGTAKLFG